MENFDEQKEELKKEKKKKSVQVFKKIKSILNMKWWLWSRNMKFNILLSEEVNFGILGIIINNAKIYTE